MPSNVPKIQFTNTGLVIPEEKEILAGVQADINEAFGGNVNPALETPQGQIASSTTAIIGDVNNNFAYFVNQVDPQYADGLMQDAIAKIYFLDRKPALPTTVNCTCVGAVGTVIPVGARVNDASKNIYICTSSGTIPAGGSISLPFANIKNGPIPCNANTVNKIYKSIVGWDTVNNPSPGAIGSDVESRSDFETRRRNSVAINGQHSLQAIYGEVFNCDGVLDVYCAENCTGSAANFGPTNYSINAHAIYVAVVGGSGQDIAEAIWRKKSLGCDMMGNQTKTVEDKSGYYPPYPQYTIKYNIPVAAPIYFEVSIYTNTSTPAGIDELIKTAIINAFIGSDGSPRARIGTAIYAANFYPAVYKVSRFFDLQHIFVGISSAAVTSQVILVGIDKVPTLQPANIIVNHV